MTTPAIPPVPPAPKRSAFFADVQAAWISVRSNPVFVTVSSAMVGAIVSAVQDEMASGKIDWSRGGINKLTGYAVTAGIAAIIHLYRPNPPSKP